MPATSVEADAQPAFRQLACDLADAARACCLPLFRSGILAENKVSVGFDPVTEADRAAEAAMRTILAERRPEDGILGEEFGHAAGTSGLTWVLDPIDGTRAFMSGAPTWGTLIGLDAGEGPVLGVIDLAFTDERLIGGFGTATYLRGDSSHPVRTKPCASLADAILYSTRPEVGTEAERLAFTKVADRVRLARYGFDSYGYALVAMGHADLVIEAGLGSYDIQGPQGVIEAAGGIVTDWQGGPAHGGGRVIAAGDRRVHAEALEFLSRAPRD